MPSEIAEWNRLVIITRKMADQRLAQYSMIRKIMALKQNSMMGPLFQTPRVLEWKIVSSFIRKNKD